MQGAMVFKVRHLFSALTIIGAGGVLLFVDITTSTKAMRELLNLGHLPLFFVVAVAVHRFLKDVSREEPSLILSYVIIAAIGIGLALGTEMLQLLIGRDAELEDVLRDVSGVLIYLATSSAGNWRRTRNSVRRPYLSILILLTTAVVLLILNAMSLLTWVAASRHRDSQFPILCSFESPLDLKFVSPQDATLKIVDAPQEATFGDRKCGCLELKPALYPGITIWETCPDWNGYDSLEFRVFNPGNDSVVMSIRIDDRFQNGDCSDRFQGMRLLLPGNSRISISLQEVRLSPKQRELDIHNIVTFWLYFTRLQGFVTLFVDRIGLK
jgi:hypothetical protein